MFRLSIEQRLENARNMLNGIPPYTERNVQLQAERLALRKQGEIPSPALNYLENNNGS